MKKLVKENSSSVWGLKIELYTTRYIDVFVVFIVIFKKKLLVHILGRKPLCTTFYITIVTLNIPIKNTLYLLNVYTASVDVPFCQTNNSGSTRFIMTMRGIIVHVKRMGFQSIKSAIKFR